MVNLSGAVMVATAVPRLLKDRGSHTPTAFPTIFPPNSSEPIFSMYIATEKWKHVELPYPFDSSVELNISYSICPTVCIYFDTPIPSSLELTPPIASFDRSARNCSQLVATPVLLNFSFPDQLNSFSFRECCNNGLHERTLCNNEGEALVSINSFLDLGFVFLGLFCVDLAFVGYYIAFRRRIHPLFLCGYKCPDSNVRKCPNCHIQLRREETSPCIHVICTSCNHNFDWTTAQRPIRTLCSCFQRKRNENATAPLRVEGRQRCFLCGADDTQATNTLTALEKWVIDNDERRSQRSQSEDSEEDSKCPICLHNLKALQLSCGHQFCKSCLVKCMKIKQQCPFDRITIKDAPVPITSTQNDSTIPEANILVQNEVQIV